MKAGVVRNVALQLVGLADSSAGLERLFTTAIHIDLIAIDSSQLPVSITPHTRDFLNGPLPTNRKNSMKVDLQEVIQVMKKFLETRKDKFLTEDEWCGDTEQGYHTEVNFDMDALFAQMDEFGEMLRAQK